MTVMRTTSNDQSAAADLSPDHRLTSAPEAKAGRDESVKRPPEAEATRDEPVKRPPEKPMGADESVRYVPEYGPDAETGRDESVKRPPSPTELYLVLPPEIEALFGPPPLIPGEDGEAYESLLLAVAQALKPKDTVEWLDVKDVADFTWEGQRLKRLQTQLLSKETRSCLRDHLQSAFRATGKDAAESQKLAAAVAEAHLTNDQELIAASRKKLRDPIDLDAIASKALVKILDVYGTLDRMFTTTTVRRQGAIRDIERHRGALARRRRLEQSFLVPSRAFAGSHGR